MVPVQMQRTDNGMFILGDYLLAQRIGQGAYGVVRLGKNRVTGEKIAAKIFKKDKLTERDYVDINHEVNNMRDLSHKHIIGLRDVVDTDEYIVLIQELAGGGQVEAPEGGFPPSVAQLIFRQVMLGVQHTHNNGVAHLDIKPANILVAKGGVVKLADFGLSRRQRGDEREIITHGSPRFAAPEVYSAVARDGYKADMWACGVLLYYLLTGQYPFDIQKTPKTTHVDVISPPMTPATPATNASTTPSQGTLKSQKSALSLLNFVRRSKSNNSNAPQTPALPLSPVMIRGASGGANGSGFDSPTMNHKPESRVVRASAFEAYVPPEARPLPAAKGGRSAFESRSPSNTPEARPLASHKTAPGDEGSSEGIGSNEVDKVAGEYVKSMEIPQTEEERREAERARHKEDLVTIRKKVLNNEFELPHDCSSEAQDLINGLLTVNIEERLAPGDVLMHPWMAHDLTKTRSFRKPLDVLSKSTDSVIRAMSGIIKRKKAGTTVSHDTPGKPPLSPVCAPKSPVCAK